MSIRLQKFSLDAINFRRNGGSPPTIIAIGPRGKGKSFLTRAIMYATRDVPMGMVISGTEEGNGFYNDFVPKLFIHSELDLKALEKIVDRQRERVQLKGERCRDILIVFDDCMYDSSFMRNKVIRGIFMNGRHWKIMVMICAQYCMDIPMAIRSQIDYVFMLREENQRAIQRLFINFGGKLETLEVFQKCMVMATQDYGCLVVDNVSGETYHFRASKPPEFMMFGDHAQKYAKVHTREGANKAHGPVIMEE